MVSQYAIKFVQLSLFAPLMIATKSRKAQKLLKALRVNIFYHNSLMKPSTYIEDLELTLLAEGLILARHQCMTHIHAQQQLKRRITNLGPHHVHKKPHIALNSALLPPHAKPFQFGQPCQHCG